MASRNLFHYLLPLLATTIASQFITTESSLMVPFNCSVIGNNCASLLYHINRGLDVPQIASFYNVNASTQVFSFPRGDKLDYVIFVTSSCKNVNGTTAYFYDAPYVVKEGDTFFNVSEQIYSGQAWNDGDEESKFKIGNIVDMHLLGGCVNSNANQLVLTYTVQQNDTLSYIVDSFDSSVSGILKLNSGLIQDPNFLEVGSVLFVPVEYVSSEAPAPSPIHG